MAGAPTVYSATYPNATGFDTYPSNLPTYLSLMGLEALF